VPGEASPAVVGQTRSGSRLGAHGCPRRGRRDARRNGSACYLACLLFTLAAAHPAQSQAPEQAPEQAQDLDRMLELSLADLLSLKVVTALKQPYTINQVPATVRVITADQIRERGTSR
jgi:outer membrane receptor protein involved in Fe transport